MEDHLLEVRYVNTIEGGSGSTRVRLSVLVDWLDTQPEGVVIIGLRVIG